MSTATKAPKVATPTPPSERVALGGKERTLRFTMWSACALEDLTGRPWFDAITESRLGYARANVRLLWACLQHEGDPPAPKQVGEWLAMDGTSREVFAAVDRVIEASLPQKEAGEEVGPPEEAAA